MPEDAAIETSDADIIRRVVGGDVNAFEALVQRHAQRVNTIVKKHVPYADAAETAQDVFVRAYLALASFGGRSEFSHWLSSIAVKTCHDYWRRVYRSREVPLSALTDNHRRWLEQVMSAETVGQSAAAGTQDEARELLDRALEKLAAADRMVLELVYLEGLALKEVAALTGWSLANVKVRAFRSRARLKNILGDVLTKKEKKA